MGRGRTAVVVALLLSGCTLARMSGFDAVVAAGAERLDVTGILAWQSGDFALGTSRGHVRRKDVGEERGRGADGVGIAEVERSGRLRFMVEGPEVGGALDADCHYDRRETRERYGRVEVSEASLPLGLACAYRFDGREAGTLDVSATPSSSLAEPRLGRVRLDGVELRLRSAHAAVGGGGELEAPLGYRIEDAAGLPVGAVETNGLGGRRLALPRDPAQRRAALAAALTLALFRDPGDTD